ncbi:MAG: apolipoprotein N-acyltransferase [Gammaproteobacteria bacterium]|nr:apolipoprotein N-acyltransferase [Gammaproteobacteria bacterium]
MENNLIALWAKRLGWSAHWLRRVVALVMGCFAVLGFSPYDFPLATLMALVALWSLWSTASDWRQGAAEGMAFGIGFFGYGVSWLGISLAIYGGVPFGFTWLVVLLFVLLLSLFVAMVGALAVGSKNALPKMVWALLLLPSFWVGAEWLRVMIWDGFPWLLVGYSHADTWLAGWAPLGGTLAVSFAVSVSAGLLWLLLRSAHWFPVALAFGLLWSFSGYLSGLTWVEPKGDKTPVALIHGQVSETIKWNPDALMPILRAYQQASEPFLGSVKVIVWPETAIPTFLDAVMPALKVFNQSAEHAKTQLVTGVALREDTINGRQYFNSIAALDGSLRYDKQHLVPFSEYYPGFAVLSALAKLINMPMSQFSAGELPKVQLLAGQQVGLAVCYEADFGLEMAIVTPNTDWWLVVSDDGWFHPSAMAGQHWQMTRLRARELGREIVRVTNQGYSGVARITGEGDVVAKPLDALAGHLVSVQAYAGETPYVRYRDMPLLMVLSFSIALVFMRWRRASNVERVN